MIPWNPQLVISISTWRTLHFWLVCYYFITLLVHTAMSRDYSLESFDMTVFWIKTSLDEMHEASLWLAEVLTVLSPRWHKCEVWVTIRGWRQIQVRAWSWCRHGHEYKNVSSSLVKNTFWISDQAEKTPAKQHRTCAWRRVARQQGQHILMAYSGQSHQHFWFIELKLCTSLELGSEK